MVSATLEAILFAAAKPIAISVLKKTLDVSDEVLKEAIEDLRNRFNGETSGIHIMEHEGKIQFVTNPATQEAVTSFLKQELSGELTRPQLETLTIVGYRGPITKPEIEQIRGVNCSLILRNLLMRGLIDEREETSRLQPVYTISMELLRHLGLHRTEELPDYGDFYGNEKITELLKEMGQATESPKI